MLQRHAAPGCLPASQHRRTARRARPGTQRLQVRRTRLGTGCVRHRQVVEDEEGTDESHVEFLGPHQCLSSAERDHDANRKEAVCVCVCVCVCPCARRAVRRLPWRFVRLGKTVQHTRPRAAVAGKRRGLTRPRTILEIWGAHPKGMTCTRATHMGDTQAPRSTNMPADKAGGCRRALACCRARRFPCRGCVRALARELWCRISKRVR